MIGVGGYKAATVVIRALGPSLTQLGVTGALSDPMLALHDAQGTTVMANDNWQDTQEQDLIATTIPPSDPKESAIVATLQPGNYTAVVSGVGGSTGVGIVEIYNISDNFP